MIPRRVFKHVVPAGPLRRLRLHSPQRLTFTQVPGQRVHALPPNLSFALQRRCIAFSSVVTPPIVFASLVIVLWTYKCLMLVLFQNKIIYMPSMPPFSRSEQIKDYTSQCGPVQWRETRITSDDGVELALAVGKVRQYERVSKQEAIDEADDQTQSKASKTVIIYFQGYAMSLSAIRKSNEFNPQIVEMERPYHLDFQCCHQSLPLSNLDRMTKQGTI